MSQLDVGTGPTGRRRRRRPIVSTGLDPAAAATLPPRRPAWRRMMATSPFYMGCVLLALIIVFSILRPDSFPTVANVRNITLDVAMLQIMAVGMTFVMVGGGFDISIGSVLVFSGRRRLEVHGGPAGHLVDRHRRHGRVPRSPDWRGACSTGSASPSSRCRR